MINSFLGGVSLEFGNISFEYAFLSFQDTEILDPVHHFGLRWTFTDDEGELTKQSKAKNISSSSRVNEPDLVESEHLLYLK